MSSGGSSSTAGSNAGGATAAANQPGQAADVGNRGSDGSGQSAATNGPEGNIVEKQPNGGGGASAGGGTHEPHASSPAHQHRHGGGQGGGTTTTSTSTVLRRKTNVCLICGIYTNLSLNIFEPRNGPNIVDVIYEKYKFRAERGDNADKHICFSCNNWLINWYSLQNTSSGSSRAYEPAPSTSRSSSAAAADSSNNSSRPGGRRQHAHKPRTKAPHRHVYPPPAGDKENRPQKRTVHQPDQHGQISSTTGSLEEGWEGRPAQQLHPYAKKLHAPCTARRGTLALKESNGQQVGGNGWWNERSHKQLSDAVVSSSTEEGPDPYRILVKPFESRLIQMLQGQGTSVTKEQVAPNRAGPWVPPRTIDSANGNCVKMAPQRTAPDANGNDASSDVRNDAPEDADDSGGEIVISFDTTLSEVIDVVPSLKAIQCWYGHGDSGSSSLESPARNDGDPVRSLRQRLSSGALTVSLIDGEAHRGCSSGGYV
uniref:protein phyllopod n=1 Tax=Anopheles coluzzii TaxID=1518534 RepID=UPI0020FFDD4A|nr:protein phyllopod [Anopheles coluzzii]